MRRAAKISRPIEPPDSGNRKPCRTHYSSYDSEGAGQFKNPDSPATHSGVNDSDEPISNTLSKVVEAVRVITSADGAAIALRDQWGLVCRASTGSAPQVGSRLHPDSGLTRECFETGKPVICDDAEHDARVGRSIARGLHLGSAAIVPIREDGHIAGVLEVLSARAHAFEADDVAELERIAQALATVIPAVPAPPVAEPRLQLVAETPAHEKKTRIWPFAIAAVLFLVAALLYAGFRYRPHVHLSAAMPAPALSLERNPITQLPVPETPAPVPPRSSRVAGGVTTPQPAEPQTNPAAPQPIQSDTSATSAVSSPEQERRPDQPSTTEVATLAPAPSPLAVGPAAVPVLDLPAMITPPARAVRLPEFSLHGTIKAHSGWVTSVAFAADGQRLASGSADESLKFWDVSTGRELSAASGKLEQVQAIAFSRDGRWLAAEDSAHSVTLFDAHSGREVRKFPGNKTGAFGSKNWVYSIAFSPDGRRLATALDNKTVRLWNVETGDAIRDFTSSARAVMYIAFSPDGRWIASGADDKTINIWDVSTGGIVRALSGHKKTIYSVAFSPDGRFLASASGDKTVRIWDLATGNELQNLTGHKNLVTSVAFSPDGRWVASGSWDDTVRVWDVNSGRELKSLTGHSHPVYSVAFDPHGRWLASGSEDGSIKLWQLH